MDIFKTNPFLLKYALTSPLLESYGIIHGFISGVPWNAHFPKQFPENPYHDWNIIKSSNYLTYGLFQKHQSHIHEVPDSSNSSYIITGDGLITTHSNHLLVIQTADCIPLFLYAPDQKIIMALHVGWKGLSLNIIPHALKLLQNYHVSVLHTIAVIGPCIQQCKVRSDMQTIMLQRCSNLHPFFTNTTTLKFNLPAAAQFQLSNAGIKENHIHRIPINTFDDQRWYSYRRHTQSPHIYSYHTQPSFIMIPS